MCRVLVFEFFIDNVRIEEFKGKRVLEVGSRYVNGSIRPFIEKFLKPREYIGVDIMPGKFVDMLVPAEKLLDTFGPESFDVVVCTETLEHILNWRSAINNMKGVLKRGGYITTVKRGFPLHAYPYDFWRYELNDMKMIFKDFEIIILKEGIGHSILLKARKPTQYRANKLDDIALYSVILGKRTKSIPDIKDVPVFRKLKFIGAENLTKLGKLLLSLIKET